jgi:hypothetical protein
MSDPSTVTCERNTEMNTRMVQCFRPWLTSLTNQATDALIATSRIVGNTSSLRCRTMPTMPESAYHVVV